MSEDNTLECPICGKLEDLINSIEWLIEKEGLPEGSGLPDILKEAKELLNNKVASTDK